MIIELAFIACMAGPAGECREESIVYDDGPLLGCIVGAQAKLAEWTALHGSWRVREYACRYMYRTAEEL